MEDTIKYSDINIIFSEPLQEFFLSTADLFNSGEYITSIAGIKLGFGQRHILAKALKKIKGMYPDNVPVYTIDTSELPDINTTLVRRRGNARGIMAAQAVSWDQKVEAFTDFLHKDGWWRTDDNRNDVERIIHERRYYGENREVLLKATLLKDMNEGHVEIFFPDIRKVFKFHWIDVSAIDLFKSWYASLLAYLTEHTYETTREIPEINKHDLAEKRDQLLDAINSLPQNSMKRNQLIEQLKSISSWIEPGMEFYRQAIEYAKTAFQVIDNSEPELQKLKRKVNPGSYNMQDETWEMTDGTEDSHRQINVTPTNEGIIT